MALKIWICLLPRDNGWVFIRLSTGVMQVGDRITLEHRLQETKSIRILSFGSQQQSKYMSEKIEAG